MNSILTALRQSASLKAFTVAFLTLVLLIPLGMVRGTIADREQINVSAQNEVKSLWGAEQLIAGPILVLPYEKVQRSTSGETFVDRRELYILPNRLDVAAAVDSEFRYRGIHTVPVYSAKVKLRGSFSPVALREYGIEVDELDWQRVRLSVGVSDGRAIVETPQVSVQGEAIQFLPGGKLIPGLPPQVIALLPDVDEASLGAVLNFDIDLDVNGTESLAFLPVGATTTASMTSSWSSPSFSGSYLPETREISDDGFTANWKISSIGRQLPSTWTRGMRSITSDEIETFGVRLYSPIDIYRLTLRAATYGVLFVALTFVAFFLFEMLSALRLHPIQYLNVGFSNVIFFLLLISLAEHVGFGLAYLVSGLASSALIVGYSLAILGRKLRVAIIGMVLVALYSFLYMTLRAETYALLAGSVGLWTTMALLMYLTRRIDWYHAVDSLQQQKS